MLFTRVFKEGIRAGRITRTYRVWKRPQAKSGGRYNLPPDGIIEVDSIALVKLKNITDADAKPAGFETREALEDFLAGSRSSFKTDVELYQIDFHFIGGGAVRVPEKDRLAARDLEALTTKLRRMDDRSEKAWTNTTLALICNNPATRAGDLAPSLGWETQKFKSQVRKLKSLGLTQSLETGYRLSPRGRQVLKALPKPQDSS